MKDTVGNKGKYIGLALLVLALSLAVPAFGSSRPERPGRSDNSQSTTTGNTPNFLQPQEVQDLGPSRPERRNIFATKDAPTLPKDITLTQNAPVPQGPTNAPIPEPATLALVGSAMLGLAKKLRK